MSEKLKPCPFCGGTKLVIDSRNIFEKLQRKKGAACISLDCMTPGCNAHLYEHTHNEHDYDKRVEMLVEKWNMRANDERKT